MEGSLDAAASEEVHTKMRWTELAWVKVRLLLHLDQSHG